MVDRLHKNERKDGRSILRTTTIEMKRALLFILANYVINDSVESFM